MCVKTRVRLEHMNENSVDALNDMPLFYTSLFLNFRPYFLRAITNSFVVLLMALDFSETGFRHQTFLVTEVFVQQADEAVEKIQSFTQMVFTNIVLQAKSHADDFLVLAVEMLHAGEQTYRNIEGTHFAEPILHTQISTIRESRNTLRRRRSTLIRLIFP